MSVTRSGIEDELSLCVRCGRCRSVCPTFEVERSETSVARGRVVLARHLFEGLAAGGDASRVLNTCLLCMACEEVCTNGVPIARIVEGARSLLVADHGVPKWKGALSWVLGHPKVMDWLSRAGGLTTLLPQEQGEPRGLLLRVPRFMEEGVFLPPLSVPPFRKGFREEGGGRAVGKTWVLLFLGCLIDHCYPEIASATVRLLSRLGYACLVPEDQYCCGHPHLAMGFSSDAERIASLNTEVFKRERPDLILTACASCASTLKRDYGLSIPVLDLVELLKEHQDELVVSLPEGVDRVTWHQPCHLGRGQGIDGSGLVEALFGDSFAPMENPHRCCGFGGAMSVEFSRLSGRLGKEKAAWAKKSGAQLVLTDCPACVMQIERSLLQEAEGIHCTHLVTLLS